MNTTNTNQIASFVKAAAVQAGFSADDAVKIGTIAARDTWRDVRKMLVAVGRIDAEPALVRAYRSATGA